MRKAAAFALALALQGAALTAPLVHAHPDDHDTDHHAARTIHSHWGGHTHATQRAHLPSVGDDDHDGAVFLNTFVAVAVAAFAAPAIAVSVFTLSIPAEHLAHRVPYTVHSHDPPVVGLLPSRAPPPLPVLI